MNSRIPVGESLTIREGNRSPSSRLDSLPDVPALTELAARALVALFDRKKALFSRRVILTESGFRREETSRKCTAIALIGLQRFAESGGQHPFDVASIQDALFEDVSWVKSIGDLGILTRLVAECRPEKFTSFFSDFDFSEALERFEDGRQARTAGLACFLSGIAHARLAGTGNLPDLTDVAVDVYRSLEENQSDGGIFGQSRLPGFFQQPLSSRFGTLTDQAHAIYALAIFARAFQIEEPLGTALNCANAIRAVQGEQGQWWFLYDKRTCRVVNRYPVRSIHQDGIIPMALLALEEVTGQSFFDSIYTGLSWVTGSNELGMDLRNRELGFIWDSIEPKSGISNYCEAALNFIKSPGGVRDQHLKIRYEARPEHFGWLLCALSSFNVGQKTQAAKAAVAG